VHAHLRNYSDIASLADKVRIQVNDTHPTLAIVELMHILIKQFDFTWGEAFETVRTCSSYTNHTVLRESLEEWNENRLEYLLPRQYRILQKLNLDFCNAVRKKYPGNEEKVRRMSIIEGGQVKMAHLAIYASHQVNGVAALHTEILKKDLFKDFYEMFPEKFINVTNGVTQRRWLLHANPLLAAFITKRIGSAWTTDFRKMEELAKFAADRETQKEFLEIKKANKLNLIRYLQDQDPLRDARGKAIGHFLSLDEEALFDVQIKRIHEYKRQLMNALHVLMVYLELKENVEARQIKRMVLFAGKAAPGYEIAKGIIQLIYAIARKVNADPVVQKKLKVAFIENYNASKAEIIIPAADLSEQISTAGMEASGTGNMKLSINGALTIGTEDGANVEMHEKVGDTYWPFSFGASALQNLQIQFYNPLDIYKGNIRIQRALDMLQDHSLAETEEEHAIFKRIHASLLSAQYGNSADRFFVLNDLEAYYQTQKKVEALYAIPFLWAEYAIHNMASMGSFSTDTSIYNYANLIWDLKQCPLDKEELSRVRAEYSEHDKCRIFVKK